MKMPKLITVIPCYNEEAVLQETLNRLCKLYEDMESEGMITPSSKLLFVDDGSVDQTWPMIIAFHQQCGCACGMKLAHNAGHQNALWAGLSVAVEDADVMVTCGPAR